MTHFVFILFSLLFSQNVINLFQLLGIIFHYSQIFNFQPAHYRRGNFNLKDYFFSSFFNEMDYA